MNAKVCNKMCNSNNIHLPVLNMRYKLLTLSHANIWHNQYFTFILQIIPKLYPMSNQCTFNGNWIFYDDSIQNLLMIEIKFFSLYSS